jgi:hypothetical protein
MAAEGSSTSQSTSSVSKGCFLFNPAAATSSRKKKASIHAGEKMISRILGLFPNHTSICRAISS